MSVVQFLESFGLRKIRKGNSHRCFEFFRSFKECVESHQEAFPSIRIPISICSEADRNPETCVLVFGEQYVIRGDEANLKNGVVTIGPLYLEIKAEHST